MEICESYMFEFSANKDMKKIITMIINRKIPAHLLAYLLTLIIKELKIDVEKGRVVTTLNVVKH